MNLGRKFTEADWDSLVRKLLTKKEDLEKELRENIADESKCAPGRLTHAIMEMLIHMAEDYQNKELRNIDDSVLLDKKMRNLPFDPSFRMNIISSLVSDFSFKSQMMNTLSGEIERKIEDKFRGMYIEVERELMERISRRMGLTPPR